MGRNNEKKVFEPDTSYWWTSQDCGNGKIEYTKDDHYPKKCPNCGSRNIMHPLIFRGGPESDSEILWKKY